ncbi:galactosylgalactosylxylosylprotein 3-beta-glucuronosyltransferase P-like isoform X1 [Macrobrachium nipponense]|uniref:galactosylgalactosylxylosylprotein 3-beta-glucuronosyltransferase P-like isoform X1 n=2 Tax=Macrobrachium nipponense TaxID=159736 RepID=UPI0030C7A9F8
MSRNVQSIGMRRGLTIWSLVKWGGGSAVVLLLLVGLSIHPRKEAVVTQDESAGLPARSLQNVLTFLQTETSGKSGRAVPLKSVVSPDIQETRHCKPGEWIEGLPPLYIVTPTYPRAEQLPELTRFAQTLMNVPNVVWIVSEDAAEPTQAIVDYLKDCGLKTVYLRVQMPTKYQKVKNKPRGVANRLAGLNWIRANAKDGVFYFADDDNTYDIRLFEQMRWTRGVSMFPVGLVTSLGVSTPIVKEGKVVGFYDGWIAKRKFPIDMAGFAVNVQYLLQRPNATMPFKVGYEEDGFVKSLGITPAEIEPLAFNCTKIWVWHTQTKKNNPATPVVQNNATVGTNLDIIKNLIWKGKGNEADNKIKSKGAS